MVEEKVEKKGPNPSVGILGYGIVGKALIGLYKNSCFGYPVVKDANQKDQDNFDYSVEMDVLNICIPYDDDFVKVVVDEIKKTKAKLTIIYSAVAPLTTKQIRNKVRRAVIHSPVIGPNKNLHKCLSIFTRFIGAERESDAKLTKEHFSFLDYKRRPIVKIPSVTTEINKLISTTYFGTCIAFADYVDKLCEVYKVPFSSFTEFNEVYNRGYRRKVLKMRKMNRPSLTPPRGPISGSSVVPNTKILQESLNHKILEAILEVK